MNCSFKIFGKAINNSLTRAADRLISKNQTAFRFILESVVAAHEILHNINKNKESGVVLKLDYEKAYERVSWSVLEDMLLSRGFGETWVSGVMKIVKGGSFCVRITDGNSTYFKHGKGLRQETLYLPCCLILWQIFSLECL
jgi:hypothetical protein